MKKIVSLSLILILISCAKKDSSSLVSVNLTTFSAYTGDPVEVHTSIEYSYLAQTGSSATPQKHTEKIYLGETVNGKLSTQADVPLLESDLYLVLSPSDASIYPQNPYQYPYGIIRKLISRAGHNTIHQEINQPYIPYELSLNSISCFDENDQLWIEVSSDGVFNGEHTKLFTGCYTGAFSESVRTSQSQDLYLKFKTRKNDVLDSFNVHQILTHETVNTFTIDY